VIKIGAVRSGLAAHHFDLEAISSGPLFSDIGGVSPAEMPALGILLQPPVEQCGETLLLGSTAQ